MAAMMKNGVVAGFDTKVIAAAMGMLARKGTASNAAPTICSPGTMRKMPTNRPTATPAGTDRRVTRHSSEAQMRFPNGLSSLLRCNSSFDGACLRYCLLKKRKRSATRPHEPSLVALPGALLDGFALVVDLLAARKSEFDLRLAIGIEVDRQW